MTFTLTSPAFAHGGEIPAKYTCDGENVSPPLAWNGAPPQAKSFALIVDDPDAPDPQAPKRTWVHWVLYNIPASVNSLPEGAASFSASVRHGLNDWKRTGYGGPCPPIGRHRYVHKLYALNAIFPDLGNVTKAQLETRMQEYLVAKTELIGTYVKRG